MRNNLKLAPTAMAPVDSDFSPGTPEYVLTDSLPTAFEAGETESEAFADAVAGALDTNLNSNKTLIFRTRAWAEEQLAHVTKQEELLQTKLAAADAAYAGKVSDAQAERDAIKSDVELDLRQVTALRAAVAIFQGELRKAEL